MKKKVVKRIVIILVISLIATCFSSNVSAGTATGYQGYAVYRDGVSSSPPFGTWHAGLLNEAYINGDGLPVIHIDKDDGGGVVNWCSWDAFIDDNSFCGVYKPIDPITPTGRYNVALKARALRSESIPYSILMQVSHNVTVVNAFVTPSDITHIRCDGVIEYCYEWYGYRIFGSDSLWDITRGGFAYRDEHSEFRVTPKTQAQDWMMRIPADESDLKK